MLRRRSILYFLLFGVIFTIISVPFLSLDIQPEFTVRNPYALFYAFFFLPIEAILHDVITWLAQNVWGEEWKRNLDTAGFFVIMVFWSLLGMLIGLVSDLRGNSEG